MRASRAFRASRVLLIALSLSLFWPAAASAAPPPTPSTMAAAGDSITRAFNLCFFPFTDCPSRSWSTGSNSTVNSHALRLGVDRAYNDAVSGARMSDFPAQAATIAGRNVDYVTVLMGGNDVCTDTVAQMADPDAYEADFRAGMGTLASDDRVPLIYVVSIPNVKTLWEILKDNSSARSAWQSYDICQSLLANPLSTDQADVDRREQVRQRNMELNQRLRAACAAYSFCRFDGEGVFGTPFVPTDVSTRDYFHPSTDGQKKLSAVSFDRGYWGTRAVNGAPTAAFTFSCTELTCAFTDGSTDPDTVAGWSWQFGDGRTSVLRHPSHSFAQTGTYDVTLYAIDRLGATWSVTHQVSVTDGGGPAPNQPPTASFTESCSDLACAFDASASADGDGTVAQYAWDFGDGTAGSGVSTSHTYASAGTYTVSLTVTDSGGATDTESRSITVAAAVATSVHVDDLAGTGANVNRNSWRATVTITVVDNLGRLVEGANVTGSFSAGSGRTCTTGSAGTCSVTSDNLSRRTVPQVTYTVTNLVHTLEYRSADNVESSVTIQRPS